MADGRNLSKPFGKTEQRGGQDTRIGQTVERELEVLALMAAGLGNVEIGKRLFISLGTVKAHSAAIYRKLDAANRAGGVAQAKDLGLFI